MQENLSPRYLAAVFVDTDVTVGDDETVIVVEVRHHLIFVANTRTISVQKSDLLLDVTFRMCRPFLVV